MHPLCGLSGAKGFVCYRHTNESVTQNWIKSKIKSPRKDAEPTSKSTLTANGVVC